MFRGSKLAQERGGVNAMGLRNPAKRAKMWLPMLALLLSPGARYEECIELCKDFAAHGFVL